MAPKCGVEVTIFGDSWRYDNQGGYLPGKVLRYLGIPEDKAEQKDGDTWSINVTMDEQMAANRNEWLQAEMYSAGDKIDVAKLNDQGISFAAIAAYLRREFLNA
jgi:hypothetical protein